MYLFNTLVFVATMVLIGFWGVLQIKRVISDKTSWLLCMSTIVVGMAVLMLPVIF